MIPDRREGEDEPSFAEEMLLMLRTLRQLLFTKTKQKTPFTVRIEAKLFLAHCLVCKVHTVVVKQLISSASNLPAC